MGKFNRILNRRQSSISKTKRASGQSPNKNNNSLDDEQEVQEGDEDGVGPSNEGEGEGEDGEKHSYFLGVDEIEEYRMADDEIQKSA